MVKAAVHELSTMAAKEKPRSHSRGVTKAAMMSQAWWLSESMRSAHTFSWPSGIQARTICDCPGASGPWMSPRQVSCNISMRAPNRRPTIGIVPKSMTVPTKAKLMMPFAP